MIFSACPIGRTTRIFCTCHPTTDELFFLLVPLIGRRGLFFLLVPVIGRRSHSCLYRDYKIIRVLKTLIYNNKTGKVLELRWF